jgi:hypothetical protein
MEHLRQVGKYIALGSCAVAIVYGVVNWRYFAPFEISVICWVGLILWLIGAAGVRIQRHLAQRSRR